MPKVVIGRYLNDYKRSISRFMTTMEKNGLLKVEKDVVVIKPNLCHYISPDAGVTTDVNFVKVIIDYLESNFSINEFIIIESENWDRCLDEAYTRLGYYELEESNDKVKLLNLTNEPSYTIEIPGIPYEMDIPELFFQDFFYISIANLKTHGYMGITGILKNNHGVFPARKKNHLHPYLMPVEHLYYELFNPDLGIIDAKVGLQGRGPTVGEPVNTNFMMGGDDAIAIDTICAKIMGIDLKKLAQLRFFYKLENFNPNDIEVIGELPEFSFNTNEPWNMKMIQNKMKMTRFTNTLERKLKDLVFLYYRGPRYLMEHIKGERK